MFKKLFRWLTAGLIPVLSVMAVNAREVTGFYWIDDGDLTPFSSESFDIPVSSVSDGLHMLNLFARTDDGVCSSPVCRSFLKIPATAGASSLSGLVIIDGGTPAVAELSPMGTNTYSVDIDMTGLAVGVHSLQFLALSAGGSVSDIKEAWYYRSPTDSELNNARTVYFIDGKEAGQIGCTRDGALYKLDIDATALATGVHSIDMALVMPNGETTGTISAWFYKAPVPPGVVRYEYWFNDDYEAIQSVTLESAVPDFSLITMLDVPELPSDSRKYAFSIVDGNPTVSDIQRLSMRFFESDGRLSYGQSEFIDSRSARQVTGIQPLEDGANKIASLESPEIKWYSFEGEVGDSIALRADRAMMLELYSPDGNDVVKKKGSAAEELFTTTLTQTGTYYLAAHDVMVTNKRNLSIGFHHIPRNAILEVTPLVMTSSDTFTLVELFGNGMSNARTLILDNGEGASYVTEDFASFDNYNLSATITLDGPIPQGTYDVTLVVDDPVTDSEQRITKAGAITVIEAGAPSDIKVEVVPSRKASTPYMVDIRVTNDSDVPCWGVPVNVACERDGGSNGFVFYMSDFMGMPISANTINWYESDNILGTGTDGVFFPITINYMQPHETRTLQVGIIAEPHKVVGLYAWAGIPFNEEAAQLKAMPEDSLRTIRVQYSNLFNLKTAAYILTVMEKLQSESPSKIRGLAKEDNQVLENLNTYGPDVIGNYTPFEKSADMASLVANTYIAIGKTEASIINLSTAGNYSLEVLRQNGYHGTPQQVLSQVENDNRGCDEDPYVIGDPTIQTNYIQLKRAIAKAIPPRDIIVDAYEPTKVTFARQVSDWFIKLFAKSSNPMPTRNGVEELTTGDPNMITGYTDPTGGNYVGLDAKDMDYTIEFENDPEIANAPASTIVVTNILDKNVFDLESFTPESVRIGPHTVRLPAGTSFVKTVDMRPEIQCIAEVRLDFSAETGKAVWTFTSLDPLTMEPVDNSRQGLLPVNDESGCGIGFISYSVRLLDGLAHSTTFSNSASIVFDTNEPIVTDPWVNVTDYVRPEARIVKEYGYDGMAYGFDVETSDEGSGVLSYDLYARTGDSGTWAVVLGGLTGSHIEFATSEPIGDVQFMVRATDLAGNRQLSEGGLSSAGTDLLPDGGASDDERWYNLQGIPQDPDGNHPSPAIMISTKGRKIIIR